MSRRPSAEIVPVEDDNRPVKARMAGALEQRTRIARFKGSVIIEVDGKWQEMTSDLFAEACYKQFGFGINKSRIVDLEHLFRTTAEDLSNRSHLIDFGGAVWNTKKLAWDSEVDPSDCVYRVDWQPRKGADEYIPFILDLAKGDKGVYGDIMQSVAPIIMHKKPTGVIWYLGGGANGKQQRVSELIPTPKGDRRFGELRPGDEVFGSDGRPTTVTRVFPQGVQPVYRVEFTDGAYLDVGLEHLWTLERDGRPSVTCTTEELMEGRYKKYRIPMTAVQGVLSDEPVPAYELGAYIADGACQHKTARITKSKGAVRDYLENIDPELKVYDHEGSTGYLSANGSTRLSQYLHEEGLAVMKSRSKYIPDNWFYRSIEVRQELLRGLMDCDGSYYHYERKSGRGGNRIVRYQTTSEQLADDVIRLVTGLGYSARKRVAKHPKGNYYQLWLNTATFNPFKVSKYASIWEPSSYKPTRSIKDVDLVGEEECMCIMVDNKDSLYVGDTRFHVVTHNSTLVHLLYKIFGTYLTEITVKQLEDERDTPQLNGKLANICKESSEGFIEDTRTYKSIGTHESFSVHKFHSQDMTTIEGNVHHIFSANNIPTFGDKSYGARRRTLVIPFQNSFKPDEMFEEKTFTQEFMEQFISEMIKYALKLKEFGYEYRFSDTTVAMKEKYDTDANTAQTYTDELYSQGVIAFQNYRLLNSDYENWCMEHGYRPSSINVLRRAVDEKGYSRKSARSEDGRVIKMYVAFGYDSTELKNVYGRLGLYQLKSAKADIEEMDQEERQTVLEDW